MSLNSVAGYLLLVLIAVILDVAVLRWWRSVWRPNQPAGVIDQVVNRIAAGGKQAWHSFARRLPEWTWLRAPGPHVLARRAKPWPGPAPAAGLPLPLADAGRAPEQLAADLPAPAPAGEVTPTVAPAAPLPPAVLPLQVTSQISRQDSDQVVRVNLSVELPVGATLRVTIETSPGAQPVVTISAPAALPAVGSSAVKTSIGPQRAFPGLLPRVRTLADRLRAANAVWRARPDALALTLFVGAMAIYGLTRLIGLDRYPIYFFTDEAVHTVLAADFLRDGFRNYQKALFPTYFSLGPSFGLNGVSVYLQIVPYLLFGKSVAVTRGVSALVTLIAAAAVGLTLRDIFKLRFWWTATLLLGMAPAWFLHSRTAFEYVELASFYAGFIYFYLRYRCIAPNNLYAAIVFGALTFYTHGLGQMLMGVTGLLLFLVDWRYHWAQRATLQRGALLLGLLALPYLRYALANPSTFGAQLRTRDSYWMAGGLTLAGKLRQFWTEYSYGLSPAFWYLGQNGRDIERHVMDGYGNLWLPTLPLATVGLLAALRQWRSAAYRVVLLSLLATPVGSALVAIGVPRMLWAIIPLTLLTAIGLALALDWFAGRTQSELRLSVGTFALLAGVNLFMLGDSLSNGPLWSRDYTLAGTQYGARQVFGEAIPDYLREHPQAEIMVSATWANGTDLFVPFFLEPGERERVRLTSLEHFTYAKRDLSPNLLVILTRREYDALAQDPKFDAIQVERVLLYPDGSPGFYFLRFGYSAQADALFEAERVARQQPVVETHEIDGQLVTVTHPRFGAGSLQDMLDGDPFTLINAPEANPVVLDFEFPLPRALTGLQLTTGSLSDFTVTVRLFSVDTAEPVVYTKRFLDLPADPTVEFVFDRGPQAATQVMLEITDNPAGPSANIHVREVAFR